jgi:Flp pilus assembly protein TadG
MIGRALPRDRRGAGQALVEFALVFPIIVLLTFGFLDVGRAVLAYNSLTNAARQAARVATVSQIDPAATPYRCEANRPTENVADPYWTFRGCAMAAGASIGLVPADITVSYAAPPGTTLECSSAVNVGCIVSITVSHQFDPITPLAGTIIGQMTMSSTSQMPVERVFP